MTGQDELKQQSKLITLRDQAGLVVLFAVSVTIIGLYWGWGRWRPNDWIEIDQAPPATIHFECDLNTAPWPEIALIPGVGEGLAVRIVKHREEHGPFQSIDELTSISGVGPKKVETLKQYLLPITPSTDPPSVTHDNPETNSQTKD